MFDAKFCENLFIGLNVTLINVPKHRGNKVWVLVLVRVISAIVI